MEEASNKNALITQFEKEIFPVFPDISLFFEKGKKEEERKRKEKILRIGNILKQIYDYIFQGDFYVIWDEAAYEIWEQFLYLQLSKEERYEVLSACFEEKTNSTDIIKAKQKEFQNKYNYKLIHLAEEFKRRDSDFLNELSKEGTDGSEQYWAHIKEEYAKFKQKHNSFLTAFPEVEDYGFNELDSCSYINFIRFGEDLCKYIEDGIIPIGYTQRLFANANAYKELESRNYELTPEQQVKATKLKEVCELAGNDAWQLLLNAEIIKWKDNTNDLTKPFCELNERYRNGSANNALLLFCVCSVNEMLEIYKEDKTEHWKPTNGYNTMVINPQIETLFGKEMKQAIAAAKRDNDISKYKRLPFGYKNVLKAVEKKTET